MGCKSAVAPRVQCDAQGWQRGAHCNARMPVAGVAQRQQRQRPRTLFARSLHLQFADRLRQQISEGLAQLTRALRRLQGAPNSKVPSLAERRRGAWRQGAAGVREDVLHHQHMPRRRCGGRLPRALCDEQVRRRARARESGVHDHHSEEGRRAVVQRPAEEPRERRGRGVPDVHFGAGALAPRGPSPGCHAEPRGAAAGLLLARDVRSGAHLRSQAGRHPRLPHPGSTGDHDAHRGQRRGALRWPALCRRRRNGAPWLHSQGLPTACHCSPQGGWVPRPTPHVCRGALAGILRRLLEVGGGLRSRPATAPSHLQHLSKLVGALAARKDEVERMLAWRNAGLAAPATGDCHAQPFKQGCGGFPWLQASLHHVPGSA
mmetsp:Transcript_13335/g.41140  ORF Transcript_13335/g.41140 Transcript_13335/m.41140 type:complete len:375 (+) Transcript_13335:811-1935(+)